MKYKIFRFHYQKILLGQKCLLSIFDINSDICSFNVRLIMISPPRNAIFLIKKYLLFLFSKIIIGINKKKNFKTILVYQK